MSVMSQLNSPVLYLICGGIILFVALVCVVFLVRAYRAGVAIGMDRTKLKRTITASAMFTMLPAVGILLKKSIKRCEKGDLAVVLLVFCSPGTPFGYQRE